LADPTSSAPSVKYLVCSFRKVARPSNDVRSRYLLATPPANRSVPL